MTFFSHIGATVGKFIAGAALVVAGWLGFQQPAQFGAVVYKPIPRYESSLAISLDANTTSSMTLVNGKDNDGNTLSGPMCFTLDTGLSTVEDVCGNASGTVISDLVRGVDASGVTSNSSDAHAHRVGADVKVTDSPYLGQYYRLLNGIDGFPNALQYAAHPTSTASTTIEDKNYIDSNIIGGGIPANSSTPGISFAAGSTQLENGTTQGTYNTTSQQYYYSLNAGQIATTSKAYSIPLTNASGTLDTSFASGTSPTFDNVTASSVVVSSSITAASLSLTSGMEFSTSSWSKGFYFEGPAIGATSSFNWTVPQNVTSVTIVAAGGESGNVANSLYLAAGGISTGTLAVVPGTTYTVAFGGYGAQCNNIETSGGDYAAVFTTSTSNVVDTSTIVIMGGGAGGANGSSAGGNGGGVTGASGSAGGGTQTTGGAAQGNGKAGSFLQGGAAVCSSWLQGAGGGGLYGGGSGGSTSGNGGTGGGGSGYLSPSLTSTSTQQGGNTANPYVNIIYNDGSPTLPPNAGTVAWGSINGTTTITFSSPFANVPSCSLGELNSNLSTPTSTIPYISSLTTSTLAINLLNFQSNAAVSYTCF